VFQPKNNSRCHHRRGRRRTFPLRPIQKTTTKTKTTESLTFLNVQTSQIRNEEQNSRPSKEQELRRQTTHILEQLPEQQTQENDGDDNEEAIDKELEIVQLKYNSCRKKKKNLRANCKQKERPLKS
jgi:hypothetical protein